MHRNVAVGTVRVFPLVSATGDSNPLPFDSSFRCSHHCGQWGSVLRTVRTKAQCSDSAEDTRLRAGPFLDHIPLMRRGDPPPLFLLSPSSHVLFSLSPVLFPRSSRPHCGSPSFQVRPRSRPLYMYIHICGALPLASLSRAVVVVVVGGHWTSDRSCGDPLSAALPPPRPDLFSFCASFIRSRTHSTVPGPSLYTEK